MSARLAIAVALVATACDRSESGPDVVETERFTAPIPSGWKEIPVKYLPRQDLRIEAAFTSLDDRGGITIMPLPDDLPDRPTCRDIARAHAALDAKEPAVVTTFARGEREACRWSYSKPPASIVATAVSADLLVLCVLLPDHPPSARACDEVAAGFSVKR